MHIRLATPDDADRISALILGVAHFFTLRPAGEGAEEFLVNVSPEAIGRFLASPQYVYRVAEEAGELMGVVAIRDNGHLYHLFVAPGTHGRGLGRELWTMAMGAALAAGNPGEFTVNSTPYAVPVYERFGFRPTGPRVETMGIAYVPMKLVLHGDADDARRDASPPAGG